MTLQPSRRDDRQYARTSLRNALLAGHGHIAVITGRCDDSLALVEEGLQHVQAHAVFRIRAMSDEPLRDADRELGIDAESASTYRRQRALERCIEDARAADASILALILDAETADADSLERVRMVLECVPLAIGRVRIILIGAECLAATLAQPAASALASRIGTRVDIAPEKLEPVVMQAATFANRAAAYSLQRILAEQVTDVRVTELESPSPQRPHGDQDRLSHGRVYSVRVVGLRTHGDIARAESAIRGLGHDPVRIAAESRRSRRHAGGEHQGFWTRLFGR